MPLPPSSKSPLSHVLSLSLPMFHYVTSSLICWWRFSIPMHDPVPNNYRPFIKLTSIAHLPARQRQPQVGGLQGPPSREEAHIALLSRRGRDIPGGVRQGRGRGVVHVSLRYVCVVEDLLLTFDDRQVSICAWRWDDGNFILTGALLVGSDMSNATRRNLHVKTV